MAACLELCESPKAKLAELSCPFTWNLMDFIVKHYTWKHNTYKCDETENQDELSDDIPIAEFVKQLQNCYTNVLSANIDSAEENLRKANALWMDQLRDSDDIPRRTFEHILNATKCFYFYENNEEQKLNNTLKNISNISDFSEEELGALEGCKSVAYSRYHLFSINESIAAATKAVEQNKNNALWHLVLAKGLRIQRRLRSIQSSPTPTEKIYFESAYRMCKQPAFIMYYAQMLNETLYNSSKEKKKTELEIKKKVVPLYNEVFKSDTQDYRILLKLALGYIRIHRQNEMIRAHICLDIVDRIKPKTSTSLHYRGLIYKACGEYKDAIKCFKEAADLGDLHAEFNYVEYGWEICALDPVEYLLNMLKRHKHVVKEKKQEMLIHVATCYYVSRSDIQKAGEYYLKAIIIHPKSRKLNSFYRFSHFYAPNGIRSFLKVNFLPQMKSKLEAEKGVYKNDKSLLTLFQKLNNACTERDPKDGNIQLKDIDHSLESINIRD